MTVASGIYEGRVVHHRRTPIDHRFDRRLFMLLIDLDELPHLFRGAWPWSATRPAPAWFRRADHLGDPRRPLADAVRDLVAERLGRRPGGPVRLLTHLRYLGVVFNPISLYYCYGDVAGTRLEAVVAEVTNTPWGERHAYVLDTASAADGRAHGTFRKAMHVSPFLPMDIEYHWSLSAPSSQLSLSIVCRRGEEMLLTTGLSMRRSEVTPGRLRSLLVRYPPMSLAVLGGIYAHALRLRSAGARYHPHPAR